MEKKIKVWQYFLERQGFIIVAAMHNAECNILQNVRVFVAQQFQLCCQLDYHHTVLASAALSLWEYLRADFIVARELHSSRALKEEQMLQIGGTQSTVNLFKVHYFSLPFNHYLLSISSDRMILKRMAEKGQLNRHFFKPILIIFGIITPSIKR